MIPGEPSALVLTALPVEMAAVLARLSASRSSAMVGPVLCELGHFTASGGRSWRVAVAELGPGTVDTAAAAATLAAHFQPDVLMFTGIAGALSDDLAIGDVVAGTEVAWTERGKWSPGGYQARIRTVSLSAPLSQLSRKIAREGSWTGRLAQPRPGAKAVVGQIACGEKVVADTEYRAWLRAAFSDAVAVENEGFALARAGEAYAEGQRYVVRGISDYADGVKSDDGHAAAADAAAAFAFELLDTYGAQVRAGRPPVLYPQSDDAQLSDIAEHSPPAAPARMAARHAGQGDKLCAAHRYREAEAEYRTAIAVDPRLARAHAGLGRALHMRLAYAEAEVASRDAVRLDPGCAIAHANLGRTLANLGRCAEAESECQAAISIDPGCAIAHANLGRVLGDLARYPEAEAACRAAIRLDPMLAAAYSDLGDVLYRQRRYTAAEAAYRQAAHLDECDPYAREGLGEALSRQGQYAEAAAAYRAALRVDPGNEHARDALANVLVLQEGQGTQDQG